MKKGTSNNRFTSFVDADFFCLSKDVKFLRTIFLQVMLHSHLLYTPPYFSLDSRNSLA
jgi:hypothetical protein